MSLQAINCPNWRMENWNLLVKSGHGDFSVLSELIFLCVFTSPGDGKMECEEWPPSPS